MSSLSAAFPCVLVACVLVACGGGDNSSAAVRAQADQAEAFARSLIQVAPCTADAQCGFVTFQSPVYDCSQGKHAPYLLASETASALMAAAEEQRRLALEARSLEPPPNFACAAFVEPPPLPVCVQSQCTLKFGPFPLTSLL